MKGIDEKFTVNAVNGTATFALPLPFSPARGLTPNHTLVYNSGAGNGLFGLGWNIDISSITRKTSKGLPQYQDDADTFVLSDAEDLVPAYKKNDDGSFAVGGDSKYLIHEKTAADGEHQIRYYLPRIEGLFARIERWKSKTTGHVKWRITSRENITTLYGWTADSRIADPNAPHRIFKWLPEFVFDDRGNCTHYQYKKEDDKDFDPAALHNRNRLKGGQITYTNTYLVKILYGNRTPYRQFGDPFPGENDYLFSLVFDFGEYDSETPGQPVTDWAYRSDAFSNYLPGFEWRTTRLCRRVLLFHHFTGAGEYEGLVRSLDFTYDTGQAEDFTFLTAITASGYIKKPDGTYSRKSYPPLNFSYQDHAWNREIQTISPDELTHAPAGLEEPQYKFTDLYHEGLAGILTEQGGAWYYKQNLGRGKFAQARPVVAKPSFQGLDTVMALADLDADGGRQLVSRQPVYPGYFELDETNEWQSFQAFEGLPNIDLRDPNVRMLDLNGDGRPDVVITEENVISWYPSEGRKGYAPLRKSRKTHDEEEGPHLVFADNMQTIFLADMSGDGMTDLVRIRNGEVCYWPNLGYGNFGSKVTMDDAPVFDRHGAFHPAFLRLEDIDGSGTTDIIYLGKDTFSCWKNLNGNRFGKTPFEIGLFNEVHNRAQVSMADLLGNGVACIVWSSPMPKDACAPLRYIDLMDSRKPHVLVAYTNNMGKEVNLEYTPSTYFYLEDKNTGRPWITKLHFPVQCVSRMTTRDLISGYQLVQEYKYHHGYYDHPEREFRGFGMVERTDAESFEHWVKQGAGSIVEADLQQEPIVYKLWHHTGAFLGRERILSQFADDYWYRKMERQGFPVVHYETELPDAAMIVAPGLDPALLDDLPPETWREALRACKGMNLRTEVFAEDAAKSGNTEAARKKALTPFTVSLQNCVIELLQPKGENRHAVFVVKNSESLTYHYERLPEDPRIAHSLNTELDAYGNVLQSAAVVYPRKTPDPTLPPETRQAQAETVIIFKDNRFTNDVVNDDAYRLRLPSETRTFQLKGVQKSGDYYTPSDFADILSDTRSDPVLYQEIDLPPPAGRAQRRLVEHVRSTYYRDDLSGALPLHQMESLGFSFESYQLAYTPGLLTDIFGARVNTTALNEGAYTHFEGDVNWWIASGRSRYLRDGETPQAAQDRFYTPVSYLDPFGAPTTVTYYGDYFLHLRETEDAFGNTSRVEQFNFRVLAPRRIQDMNGNFSEALHDELGLVKAVAVMGTGAEADELTGLSEMTGTAEATAVTNFFQSADSGQLTDRAKGLLQRSTSRFVYDLETDIPNRKPAVVAEINREEHFQANNDAAVQLAFEYSDGHGEVVLRKVQAEPGRAKQVSVNPDDSITVIEVDTAAGDPPRLRWVGNGRVIKNNKGNAVKDYEPYFSVTHRYENYKELVEAGVTPLLYYDAAGRLIKTKMPDGTFSSVDFDAWQQTIYDANDLVSDPECTWFTDRSNRLIDAELLAAGKDPVKEQQAADRTLPHAGTPNVLHFNSLGRPVLSVEHNKNSVTDADEFHLTKVKLDVEGNLRTVTDARGNTVMVHKFDMLGNQVYQHSHDGGQRWLFNTAMGVPLRSWDERGHEFQYQYDLLQRLTISKILGGDGPAPLDHVYGRIIYGEDLLLPDQSNKSALQARNVLGQPVKQYDTGGLIDLPDYDFKGNTPVSTRRLFKKYKEVPNWIDANLSNDLEPESYSLTAEYDALGRVTRQTMPDGSIITPAYNESGRLSAQTVQHPADAGPATYINEVGYNEKGQREKIRYGNGVLTRFYYDKQSFRLIRLESKRQNNDPLQDLYYTYDAVGNITHIEDKNVPVVFFSNQKITGSCEYTYDPLYQLIRATGRENNAALNFGTQDNWDNAGFIHELNPGNPMATRNYTQQYQYDEVGNLLQIKQAATGNNWTRNFTYAATNNRLLSTHIGGDPGPLDYTNYEHHAQHGFMTVLPHLEEMSWNFKEELVRSIRQKANPVNGTAETTYYQYDGKGQRLRKITENGAPAGVTPAKKEERIYVAGYERYRKHSGANAGLERISLNLMDEGHCFVMIDTRNDVNDSTEKQLVRYQLHNHLGSSTLELDDAAAVISYEEYHPYGTTAFQARNATIRSAAKRYRYSGMERDEETGLEYHSARYYLPWLGRWLSCDPSGIADGVNRYQYGRGNPLAFNDPGGLCACSPQKEEPEKKEKDEKKKEEEPAENESRGFFDKIKNAISSFFGIIGEAIIAAGRWIAETAVKIWDWIKEAATAAWNWIKQAAVDAWNWIKGALQTAWDWTKNAVSAAWNWVQEAAADAWGWLKNAAADAWEWMKQAAAAIWNWALAPLIRTATNALAGALPGLLTGNLGAAIGGGIAGGVTGAIHGWTLAYVHSYDWSSGTGWLQFLADNTWSLPNSVIGSLFATANIFWNPVDKTQSKNTGQLYFKNGWFSGYDTTLPGNVTVGTMVPLHESVHTDQARYFGPLYLAFQIVWYSFWLAVFPVGLPASLIVGKNYLKCIAYNNNPFEIWAYAADPHSGTSC